eukprot:Phypoly_transcript_16208.p1 GENE.Phypoly_transcript_16208~~Phypoly_transcript_16208.p1  ORF type:complete len:275 (+),score=57.03 Phypoly_transcript_16208:85-825(+)
MRFLSSPAFSSSSSPTSTSPPSSSTASDSSSSHPSPSPSTPPSTLRQIFEQVQNDKRPANNTVLEEYVHKWQVQGTAQDVSEKEKELFEMIVFLYAAPVPPGKQPMFDFDLMHSLTGSVFVHELLHHFSSEQGAKVLKAFMGITLKYYISTGRPKLFIDNLKSYKIPPSPNPWLEIIKFAIETNDVHATKACYALLQGEAWFGELDGILLRAAQMTVDAFKPLPNDDIFQGSVWCQSGLAFWQSKM